MEISTSEIVILVILFLLLSFGSWRMWIDITKIPERIEIQNCLVKKAGGSFKIIYRALQMTAKETGAKSFKKADVIRNIRKLKSA